MIIHPNSLSIISWVMFCEACRIDVAHSFLRHARELWKEHDSKWIKGEATQEAVRRLREIRESK